MIESMLREGSGVLRIELQIGTRKSIVDLGPAPSWVHGLVVREAQDPPTLPFGAVGGLVSERQIHQAASDETVVVTADAWDVRSVALAVAAGETLSLRHYAMNWWPFASPGLTIYELCAAVSSEANQVQQDAGGLLAISDFGFLVANRRAIDLYVESHRDALAWTSDKCNLFARFKESEDGAALIRAGVVMPVLGLVPWTYRFWLHQGVAVKELERALCGDTIVGPVEFAAEQGWYEVLSAEALTAWCPNGERAPIAYRAPPGTLRATISARSKVLCDGAPLRTWGVVFDANPPMTVLSEPIMNSISDDV